MKIELKEGEHFRRNPNQPIISLVEDKQRSYLWIGNNADGDKMCFATLAGPATLRKLAKAILAQVGGEESGEMRTE